MTKINNKVIHEDYDAGNLKEINVKPTKKDYDTIKFVKSIIPDKKDRIAFYDSLQDELSINDRSLNDAVDKYAEIYKRSNNPKFTKSRGILNYMSNDYIPNYIRIPIINYQRIHLPKGINFGNILAETSHAFQYNDSVAKDYGLIGKNDIFNNDTKYNTEGFSEFNAHKIIEPALYDYIVNETNDLNSLLSEYTAFPYNGKIYKSDKNYSMGGNSNLIRNGKPNIIRGGIAKQFGPGLFYMNGRTHAKGGIDIGKNPRTGVEVEDGEVVQLDKNGIRVFSAMPFLTGKSPANLVANGADPDIVFAAQENFKDRFGINDDGTMAQTGGQYKPGTIYGRPVEKGLEIVSPEFDVLTLGRLGANTISNTIVDGITTTAKQRGLITARRYDRTTNKLKKDFNYWKDLLKKDFKEGNYKDIPLDLGAVINRGRRIINYNITTPGRFINNMLPKKYRPAYEATKGTIKQNVVNLPAMVKLDDKNEKKMGGIHIDKNKRGTFTAAATKHGMGVQEFASRVLANKEDYSPAMVKKANFARNASRWKKAGGGNTPIWKNRVGIVTTRGFVPNSVSGYSGGQGGGGGANTPFYHIPQRYEEINKDTLFIPYKETFNDAFARAKRQGLDNFIFDGKTYTTEISDNPNWRKVGDSRVVEGIVPIVIERKKINYKKAGGIVSVNGNVKNGLVYTDRPKAKGGTKVGDNLVLYNGRWYRRNNNGEYIPILSEAVAAPNMPSTLPSPNVSTPRYDRVYDLYRDKGLNIQNVDTFLNGDGWENEIAYRQDSLGQSRNRAMTEVGIRNSFIRMANKDINDGKNIPFNDHIDNTYWKYYNSLPDTMTPDQKRSYLYYAGIYAPTDKLLEEEINLNNQYKVGTKAWYDALATKPYGQQSDTSINTEPQANVVNSQKPSISTKSERTERIHTNQRPQTRITPMLNTVNVYGIGLDGKPVFQGTREVPQWIGSGRDDTPLNVFDNFTNVNGRGVQNNLVTVGNRQLSTSPTIPATLPGVEKIQAAVQQGQPVPDTTGGGFNLTDPAIIGAGANILGSIGSYLINRNVLNESEPKPINVRLSAQKLKTNYNINPQLDELREQVAANNRLIANNTASSRTSLGRTNLINTALGRSRAELYGTKENKETELINQDILNSQGVRNQEAVYNAQLRADYQNRLDELNRLRLANNAALFSGLTGGINSIADSLLRQRYYNNTIGAIGARNPNVDARIFRDANVDWRFMYPYSTRNRS